jgi:dihydroorotase-like cyclic amidohydrolase
MLKHSIVSNKILCFKAQAFIQGIVLINGEFIEDIIGFNEEDSLEEISQRFQEWNPKVYKDCYVCPGLIDLSVRSEWENLDSLSQMASSGGVALILNESNLFFTGNPRHHNLYCDIGKIGSVDDIENKEIEVYAYKGYLYPPSWKIKGCLDDIIVLLRNLENSSIPLFLDCILPDERFLFQSSPCRHLSLTERINYTHQGNSGFSGAYPWELISENSSDLEDDLSVPYERGKSIGLPEITPRSSFIPCRKSERLFLVNRRLSLNDAYDELDIKIKINQNSFIELSNAEENSYKESGVTVQEQRSRSRSHGGEIIQSSEESPASSFVGRLESRRPTGLKINIISPQADDTSYVNYLAKIPIEWENNGVKKIINLAKSWNTRVHFTKLCSAAALNKVSRAKHPQFSSDIASQYLYFNQKSVKDGDSQFKDFPPIRSEINSELLLEMLKAGRVNAIASHHASIPSDLKRLNSGSFIQSLSGISSLGFVLQAVWTKLFENESQENYENIILMVFKWLALKPAKILGIQKKRGSITKGKYADIVIWKPYELSDTINQSFVSEPIYQNCKLYGKILSTIVRGKLVYSSGLFYAL